MRNSRPSKFSSKSSANLVLFTPRMYGYRVLALSLFTGCGVVIMAICEMDHVNREDTDKFGDYFNPIAALKARDEKYLQSVKSLPQSASLPLNVTVTMRSVITIFRSYFIHGRKIIHSTYRIIYMKPPNLHEKAKLHAGHFYSNKLFQIYRGMRLI